MIKFHQRSCQSSRLALFRLKTAELVLWKTVKYQVKYCIMWDFIRVRTVCLRLNGSSVKEKLFFSNFNL